MIAPVRAGTPTHNPSELQRNFLAMLPSITEHAEFALRNWRGESKEDMVQEIVANCFVKFSRLYERGKADLAFPSILASFAVRQVFSGRRVGGRLSANDIMSGHAQRIHGTTVERLDRFDDQESGWNESLVENRTAGPAETAAARIDFASWLQTLTNRDRQIAEMLANGEKTGDVAERFHLSAARVSQLRASFERSWHGLHGELSDFESQDAA